MRLGKILLLALGLCGLASSSKSLTVTSEYQVGFSSVDFNLPEGAPLGGFGTGFRRAKKINLKSKKNHTFFAPNQGTLDPVRAKAFVVKRGNEKLLFLSLDVVGVSDEIGRELKKPLKKLGFKPENVFISATHTHSGPGGLTRSLFFGLVAMDTFQKRVFKSFIQSVEEAVVKADAAVEPAEIIFSKFDVPGISRSRRRRPVDPAARVFWAKSLVSGQWLGAAVHYAIHGIALDDDNLKFSADVPGGIERGIAQELEDRNQAIAAATGSQVVVKPLTQMWNGAEGDVSPQFFGTDGITEIQDRFRKAAAAWVGVGQTMKGSWNVRRFMNEMGSPGLTLRTCFKDWFGGKEQKWLPKTLALALDLFFRDEVDLGWIEWDGLQMMTWPGEPTHGLGERLRDLALKKKPNLSDAWVLGLTNGHFAYFVTPEEHVEGGYEACFSLWGKFGGSSVIAGYRSSF
ncbi:MAG: neutral/alkaline non-lysosomal ceramidase N-terminal domain-containing protein [Bdellovibrionales bacterium]|nr:neutral/alkaline non-lysosomal ceramidase N-terminal domain-containing protein [Bdellovibrionales bacterium]